MDCKFSPSRYLQHSKTCALITVRRYVKYYKVTSANERHTTRVKAWLREQVISPISNYAATNIYILLEGMFGGVEAGTVVANPLYYQEEDNGV